MEDRGIQRATLATAAVTLALCLSAGTAQAQAPAWQVHETPGTFELRIEPGTIALEFSAVGAFGGGVRGGAGAIVSGTIPVVAGQTLKFAVAQQPAAIDPSQAGAGGEASTISVCPTESTIGSGCAVGNFVAVAAGGGGSGAGTALLPGGAGGAAGAPGSPGTPAPTAPEGAGAAGGPGADPESVVSAPGGAGGVVPPECASGWPGGPGRPGNALGAGGSSSLPGGAGGGGGHGVRYGGGGGGAAICQDELAGSGGGGGGGTSVVPPSAALALNAGGAFGPPGIRYRPIHEAEPPTIAITVPAEHVAYPQDAAVTAAFTCTDAGAGVASCTATTAAGAAIDTATPGNKTFTVTARDRVGNVATRSVAYTVVAPPPPALNVRGVKGSRTTVRFTLSVPARVTLRIERRTSGARRARARRRGVRWAAVRTVRHAGRAGANRVALSPRKRSALRPGTYRIRLAATANGRTVRVTSRPFAVKPRSARRGGRGAGHRRAPGARR